jgi:hypothetical protein
MVTILSDLVDSRSQPFPPALAFVVLTSQVAFFLSFHFALESR